MTKTEPQRLDLRGLNCPLPVLKAAKALIALSPGDLLGLAATDPMAAIDIPHFCRQKGHRLVDQTTEDAVLRFTIAKGE